LRALSELQNVLDAPIPAAPPPAFRPMTWDEVRSCERLGATFGPHGVTHGILSRLDAAQAEQEIVACWRSLQAQTQAPVKVFCYPNGKAGDFTDRDVEILRRNGFHAALTSIPGYCISSRAAPADAAFRIPRFGYPDSREEFARIVSGVVRLRQAI
jgi:peptidoglycan/xylan/chitin deacetylase (PgdA/CDA1 family)